MSKLMLALLALLAACAAPAPPRQMAFRDQGVPIYSGTAFDAARLTGGWRQVAAFGPAGCAPGGVDFGPGGTTAVSRLCLAGGEARFSGPIATVGPGRLAVGGAAWWVLWVDSDYRTMVVGTPSGSFGFILNRRGALPPDRLEAARSVLAFNGYDLGRLRVWR